MARNITPKQNNEFVDRLCKELLKVGAVKVDDRIDTRRCFELETVVGKLNISVEADNVYCYTMFSRFDNVEEAKKKFVCNPFSGKYNVHVGKTKGMTPKIAVDVCMAAIEMTLPKETA